MDKSLRVSVANADFNAVKLGLPIIIHEIEINTIEHKNFIDL